ncbi:MAG: hypothetical protein ACFFER_15965 [Candidatus Thorarchaeota archaeon]
MKKESGRVIKAFAASLILLFTASLLGMLYSGLVYSTTYKAVKFGEYDFSELYPIGPTAYIHFPYEELPDIQLLGAEKIEPEPVPIVNATANGTAYFVTIFESLPISYSGGAISKNMKALEDLEISSRVHAWSQGIIDLFVNVTKAKDEMKDLFVFVTKQNGIQNLLDSLESIGTFPEF